MYVPRWTDETVIEGGGRGGSSLRAEDVIG